jgi:tRNA threonylcarbamoyl adenosine modification protein (Sua5/YciO/YrdC/YwlC family)
MGKDVSKCIEVLQNGGVAVILTDTVYGIVCRADDRLAVERLYGLKHRQNNPGPVIASSIDQLVNLGIKRRYLTAVSQFWPGKVSIEIPHDLDYLNQNTGRQAFRVVDDKELQKILDKTGPLLTSSANLPGQPTAKNIDEAKKYFNDKIDFYLDGGEAKDKKPSTLIRIVDDAVEVVRQGAVKIDETGRVENEL